MTELEDRIRAALQDPRWELPVWPDPMSRVRRAAARQRTRLAAATAVLLAAVVTTLALLPGIVNHRSGVKPSEVGASRTPSGRSAAPSVPSWAKRLRGEVAYKCADSLCLMRPDGTGKRTLIGASIAWDPAWSPDGRRLAFRGYYKPYAEGDYAIYVGDANGCHLTKLAGGIQGINPSWSPSGRRIAFAAGGIKVVNANGAGLRGLTSDRARSGRDRYADFEPAWSATNRIAFVRFLGRASIGEIYTMNSDGSGVAALTHGGPEFGQPSWSPDGKSIAFVANPGSTSGIEVAAADGTGVHQVSPRSWTSYSPTWTPGGKIVFIRQIHGPRQPTAMPTSAYIVNRDGSGLRLLYPKLDAIQIAWGAATLPRANC
jgi:TolB protein